MELTKENIKTLKYEKRIGFVFAGIILAFGLLFNLFFIATKLAKSYEKDELLILIAIDLLIVGLSYLTASTMNRKINKDLREGIKIVRIEKIDKKNHIIDYEAGSGSLYIPGLGDLFPKLWGQEMRSYSKYVLTIKGIENNVEKELFDNVKEGDLIEVHDSKHSDIFLEFKKIY